MAFGYHKRWGGGSGSTRGGRRSDYFNSKRRLLYSAGDPRGRHLRGKKSLGFGFALGFFRIFSGKNRLATLAKFALAAGLIIIIVGLGVFAYFSKDLPDPNKLNARIVAQSTRIYDRNGELLYDIFGDAKRTLIDFEIMPQDVKNATIAVEDKDFYKHKGISLTRLVYSVAYDIVTLSKAQGASTITQQLIKNAFLTQEKLFSRKIKEIVLAVQIERTYSKDEILKMYLNEIPYGSNVYGVQAAAQSYFGKDAKDLTLTESAYLAALPQAPSFYLANRDRLEDRKNLVLRLMRDQGYITEEQMRSSQSETVAFSPVRNSIRAPHFVLYVQELLAEKYGEKTLQEGGLQVTTTLDLKIQRAAEESIAEFAQRNEQQYNAKNAALVAIDPKTGQILAMVGSRNYFEDENDGQVNVALRPRQPGSSFKPYVYATAFKKGYSPATMLMDVTTNFGDFGGQAYVPQNYDGRNHGPVSMRQALAGSLNIPAVKTILLTGIKDAIDTAHDLGITTLTDETRYGPSLVLGGGEVRLLDHVGAFGVFAAGGIRKPVSNILKVTDSQGKILEEYREPAGQQVLDAQVAFLITSVLSDNSARAYVFGARNNLTLPDRPAAAKTGTTQEYKDAWTVGYVPQLAAGVWVGNTRGGEMKRGADGSVVAAPIWNAFMRKALADQPAEPFARPAAIRDIAVDSVSGKLPTQHTPSTKPEVFASFALPEKYDDVHVPITLDRSTNRVASPQAPPETTYTQIFTIFHSEKPEDSAWEDPVYAWAIRNGYPYPEGYVSNPQETGGSLSVSISQPAENEKIRQLPLPISISASGGVKKITLYFDGREIFSNNSSQATFFYSKPHPDGPHTIKAVAENDKGDKAEITRRIAYETGSTLALTQPADAANLTFPSLLVAQSTPAISEVKFYYRQEGESEAIEVPGTVLNVPTGGFVEFRLNWPEANRPSAGDYEIFAASGNVRSNSVTVTVP